MRDFTRREVVTTTLGGLAAASMPGIATAAQVNEQISVAVIGVRGMGHGHIKWLLERSDVRLAALCDIDEQMLARAEQAVRAAQRPSPALVTDFRDVLDDEAIDAVVIATPHHWHCPIAIPALQAKKDVYLEKPGSHVFREGRLLVDAANKYDRIVQHGTQMRSSDVTAKAGELLASGILGTVKMTKACPS